MIGTDHAAAGAPDAIETHRPLWRRLANRNLLYALAVVFLAVVLWRSRFWDSGDAIRQFEARDVVLVPLLSLALAIPLAMRQRLILSSLGFRFPVWSVAPITYYGNTVGFMTPASSGELLRPSLFQRIFGLPLPQGIGVVLFERVYSIFLFGLACLIALSWTGTFPRGTGVVLAPLFLAACLLPSAIVKLAPALRSRLPLDRLSRLVPHRIRDRVGDMVQESGATLQRLWGSPRLVAGFLGLSVGIFLIMGVQFWLIQDGMGQHLTLQEAWVVLAASAMAGVASGLPLGIGATDAVMLSLLKAYGVDTATAGSIVILTRTLINLPSGLFGLSAYLIAVRQKPLAGVEPRDERVSRLVPAGAGRNDE